MTCISIVNTHNHSGPSVWLAFGSNTYWRNPTYTAVRFLFATFISLFFGSVFWDLGTKVSKNQDLFNAMGSMYAAVIFLGVLNASSVQPIVVVERTVFYRERAAGMYSAIPYAFGQVFIEIPYVFVQAVSYSVIVYAIVGFEWTAAKFFWYLFVMYFTLLYFTFYGMMIIAVIPNQNVGQIAGFFFHAIWNLFSGFIIPRPNSVCPYGGDGTIGLILSPGHCMVWLYHNSGTSNKLSDDQTVEQFLRSYFGFKHDFLGVVAAMTVAYAVVFAFTFAFGIKAFNFQKRWKEFTR